MTDYTFTVRATDSAGRVATSAQTISSVAWTPDAAFSGGVRGLWIDPSDFSSMFQDSAGTTAVTAVGQSVGLIRDKSGNANHLTQATSGNRPVLAQDAGGFYYLQFTGTSSTAGKFLTGGTTANLAPRTSSWQSVSGAKFDDALAGRAIYARSKAGGFVGRYSNHRDASGQLINFWDNAGGGGVTAGDTDTSTSVRVITTLTDRIQGLLREWTNRVALGVSITFTPDSGTDRNAAYRFLVGAYNDATDSGIINPLTGRLYGLFLIFNIDSGTRQRAESYMATKCGVTL